MDVSIPHYLLLPETSHICGSGRWRFTLWKADGSEQFEATDVERKVRGERLDLLTVVRALEALDQPSRVTLIGCSPYVRQAMQYGLAEWRNNGWRWEFFGQMVPVKNGDLWQRMDRALRFHRVECRYRRFDRPHRRLAAPRVAGGEKDGKKGRNIGIRISARRWLRYRLSQVSGDRRRRISAVLRLWQRRMIQPWMALTPGRWVGQCLARRCVCGLRWRWRTLIN